jgi:sugar transferase (PEP-CTERM system associated)
VSAGALDLRRACFFVGEQLLLGGAFLVTMLGFRRAFHAPVPAGTAALQALGGTLFVQAGLYLGDLYDLKVAYADAPRGARLSRALGLVTIAYGLVSLALPRALGAGGATIAGLGAACTVALAFRTSLPRLGRRVALRGRVFVLGEGAAERLLAEEISRDGSHEIAASAPLRSCGVADRVRAARAGVLVVAADYRRGLDVRELLECRLRGTEVLDAARFVERALRKVPVGLVRPSDLVFSAGFRRPPWLLYARRMVSLVAAVALLLAAAPLLLIAAVLIKLDSPGPVLYTQERVGAGGRPFRMYKLRTMRRDAEAAGARWAATNDPRVTRVGRLLRRYRVDELPQLVNVLRGEMGVIGPRPERPEFVAQLRQQIPYYDLRTLVPPGITGWAQICYPYAASLEEAREKLHYDLYYVKHLSLLLDLTILFHTAKVVLFGRGAR